MSELYSKENLLESYKQNAPVREKGEVQEWKQIERQRFLNEIQNVNEADQAERPSKSLLELGAGAGKDSLFFQKQGLNVLATDMSPDMLELCAAKGLSTKLMDYRSIDLPDSSFDAVYALNSLLHAPKQDLPAVLEGIRGVLKSGGLFFMGVYGGKDFEGILEEDRVRPKRFFSYYQDKALLDVVTDVFELIYFRQIRFDQLSDYHFQSLILKKL